MKAVFLLRQKMRQSRSRSICGSAIRTIKERDTGGSGRKPELSSVFYGNPSEKGKGYMDNDKLQLFENKTIRTAWDEETEEWYFSVVDVISVLTGTENPRRYWSEIKKKVEG
jgi:hypothetical protein